jgi:hypothetical protein
MFEHAADPSWLGVCFTHAKSPSCVRFQVLAIVLVRGMSFSTALEKVWRRLADRLDLAFKNCMIRGGGAFGSVRPSQFS